MRFSVVTINYNNCAGLRSTMESVVSQTCTDYEYIVIDGGSADGSQEVIREYEDKLGYWVSEKDRGIYHAMNKGVARAHGDYCIFMNSGDCFYDSTVLERIARCGLNEDIIVGKVIMADSEKPISPPPSRDISLYHFYSGAIPHQGAFTRTRLLKSNPYDETLHICSDWKFFLQAIIMDNCSVKFVDELTARYDMGGVSSTNPEKMRAEKEEVLRELFPPRVLADYRWMKQSECLTQTLTPELRINYAIDKLLYSLGRWLLKVRKRGGCRDTATDGTGGESCRKE